MSTLSGPTYGEAGARAPTRPPARHLSTRSLVRLRVAAGRDGLDTMLAHGADRASRPELALRAAQLERPRHRRALARTLRGFVAEATGPRPPARATAVTIARGQIFAQRDDVLGLADRLTSQQPAHAEGIAIAQRLITDALRSPLYVETQSETLGHLTRQAIASMDAPAQASHRCG